MRHRPRLLAGVLLAGVLLAGLLLAGCSSGGGHATSAVASLPGHSGEVLAPTWSPDGKRLASGAAD